MTAETHHNKTRCFLGWLGVVCALLWIAGCSTSMVYNRLDTLSRWYIGSLVSLDDTQDERLRQWLQMTLDWHRHSELTRYAQFIRELSEHAKTLSTPQQYEQARLTMVAFWQDLVSQITPQAAQLLVQLSSRQVDELLGNLEERDRDRLKQWQHLSADERTKQRQKNIERQATKWLGSLSPQQRSIVARYAPMLGDDENETYASRQVWRSQLRAALAAADVHARVEQVATVLSSPQRSWSQSQRERAERSRIAALDMLRELDASLSPAQREMLSNRLSKMAADLEALAKA